MNDTKQILENPDSQKVQKTHATNHYWQLPMDARNKSLIGNCQWAHATNHSMATANDIGNYQ
jgi:hypothetical protein